VTKEQLAIALYSLYDRLWVKSEGVISKDESRALMEAAQFLQNEASVVSAAEPGVRIETDAEIAAGLTAANPAYPPPPKDGPAPDMRRYEPPAEPTCPCGTAYLRVEGGYVPVCACAATNAVTPEPPVCTCSTEVKVISIDPECPQGHGKGLPPRPLTVPSEPTCDHSAPPLSARWCSKCGALYDGSEWLFPSNAPNRGGSHEA